MKAVVLERFGELDEVLQVKDVPLPQPRRGEVLVRMFASPLNPSDLLMVRGRYLVQPALPAIPGFEGVGVVEASGGGLLGWLRRGRRVAVISPRAACWAEYVVVPSTYVVPIDPDLPDEQAAMFFVNPFTVLGMVRSILRVPRGAWLLQTAAASALGRMVVRLGKHDDFRTINVIRRHEQIEELRREGADAIICTGDGEQIEERVRALTGSAGVQYALDAVGGGETSAAVLRALAPKGRMLVYGLLADEPMSFATSDLLLGGKSVEGFWMTEWSLALPGLYAARHFSQIRRLFRKGLFRSEVGASFPLTEVRAAARRANDPTHRGKVLLRLASTRG
jgi:NADPH:quinone reductase-like Zn-dependent oxidoreductase